MKQKELMWRKVVEAHMPRTTYCTLRITSIHAHMANKCQNPSISCSTFTTWRFHQTHQVHGLLSKQNDITESMLFLEISDGMGPMRECQRNPACLYINISIVYLVRRIVSLFNKSTKPGFVCFTAHLMFFF